MYKIKTFNKISVHGLDRFPRQSYEVGGDIAHPDAILLRSQKLQEEPVTKTVLAIARAGAGVNNVPVEECTQRGTVVFNTPGANANAVKELVLAGMLLSCRGLLEGVDFVKSLSPNDDVGKICEAEKKRFAGSELSGKTLGVIGLGAIGSMVADAALALGMKVCGYDPALSVEAAWRLSNRVERKENLASLVAQSDYLTLHVPAIEATQGLIGKEILEQMKPGAVVLNFARGTIVDNSAMKVALEKGQVGLYVCDFPTEELLGLSNVMLVPHLGASTAEAEDNCAVMAANQLMDYLENGNIVNSVNFPMVSMARNGASRLTFCNDNVSGVLGNVLSVLADHKANVVDMVNKSRGNLAYNIIDLDDQASDELLKAVEGVENVIAARLLV